jgi:hypothetical protein
VAAGVETRIIPDVRKATLRDVVLDSVEKGLDRLDR